MKKNKYNTDYQKLIIGLGKKPEWESGIQLLCDGFKIPSPQDFEGALFMANVCLNSEQDRRIDSLKKLSKCAVEMRNLLDNEVNSHRLVQYIAGNSYSERNKKIDEACQQLEQWESMLWDIQKIANKAHQPPPKRGNVAKQSIREAVLTLAIFWKEILRRDFTQKFEDDSQTPKSEAAKFIYCCFRIIAKDFERVIPSLRRNMILVIRWDLKDYEKRMRTPELRNSR